MATNPSKWTTARKIETAAGFLTLCAIVVFLVAPLLIFCAKVIYTEFLAIWGLW